MIMPDGNTAALKAKMIEEDMTEHNYNEAQEAHNIEVAEAAKEYRRNEFIAETLNEFGRDDFVQLLSEASFTDIMSLKFLIKGHYEDQKCPTEVMTIARYQLVFEVLDSIITEIQE